MAAGTVWAVTSPCQLRDTPFPVRAALFIAVLIMLIVANSVPLTLSTAIAFAAITLHWSQGCGVGSEHFSVGAPFENGRNAPLAGCDPLTTYRSNLDVSGPSDDPDGEVVQVTARALRELTPPELLHAAQTNEVVASHP